MKRRSFLAQTTMGAGAALGLSSFGLSVEEKNKPLQFVSNSTSLETTIMLKGLQTEMAIMQISDSHISVDSEADVLYEKYSIRMRNAYRQTKHYKTGEATTPAKLFDELLGIAVKEKVKLVVLSGDIINYPSETAVQFILNKMENTGIPYCYTAGNHDWHYEGTEGSDEFLRNYWVEKRLKPLYKGSNPFFSARMEGGINVVMIDNSTYQVNKEQLDFYIKQKNKKTPMLLFVHIPLYMPSMPVACSGHPDWGASADKGYVVERREQWPAMNQPATVRFLEEVMGSQNLLGVFAGHWHNAHAISYGNIQQHIAQPGLNGQYRLIHFKKMN